MEPFAGIAAHELSRCLSGLSGHAELDARRTLCAIQQPAGPTLREITDLSAIIANAKDIVIGGTRLRTLPAIWGGCRDRQLLRKLHSCSPRFYRISRDNRNILSEKAAMETRSNTRVWIRTAFPCFTGAVFFEAQTRISDATENRPATSASRYRTASGPIPHSLRHLLYIVLYRKWVKGSFELVEPVTNKAELSKTFGVSRITLHKAINRLEYEPLTRRVRARSALPTSATLEAAGVALGCFDEHLTVFAADTPAAALNIERGTRLPSISCAVRDKTSQIAERPNVACRHDRYEYFLSYSAECVLPPLASVNVSK